MNKLEKQESVAEEHNPWWVVDVLRAFYTFFVTDGYRVEMTPEQKEERRQLFGY